MAVCGRESQRDPATVNHRVAGQHAGRAAGDREDDTPGGDKHRAAVCRRAGRCPRDVLHRRAVSSSRHEPEVASGGGVRRL